MASPKPLPPLKELRKRYQYDPETGVLSHYGIPIRSEVLSYKRSLYQVHRIIWLYITGEDPGDLQIDHIDGDHSNNRASNLRIATNKQNSWNKPLGKGYQEIKGRYYAYIKHEGKHISLGAYGTAEEATAVYKKKASELRKEWCR